MVAECDGDYTYEKRGALLWQLPMIDAKNKTGSIEFSCGGNPDDFFPVQVAFFSKKSYSGIEVCSIYKITYFLKLLTEMIYFWSMISSLRSRVEFCTLEI